MGKDMIKTKLSIFDFDGTLISTPLPDALMINSLFTTNEFRNQSIEYAVRMLNYHM